MPCWRSVSASAISSPSRSSPSRKAACCARPARRALLDEAVAQGADLLGGLDPVGIDGDLAGHLDPIFAIASKHGVGIDLHLHDGGEGGIAQMLAIAERTRASGLEGKVAIGHAFCAGLGRGRRTSPPAPPTRWPKPGIAIMSHGPGAEHHAAAAAAARAWR